MNHFKYAIGDIHGRMDILLKSVEMIEQHLAATDSTGSIIFLGDYVDRGIESRQVCEYLMSGGPKNPQITRWICLQGNHEVMLIEAMEGGRSEMDFWLANGGSETYQSFNGRPRGDVIRWMANLPKFYADGERVYVHAGIKENVPLDQQPEAVLQWIRYKDTQEINVPEGYVVHGHTPRMGTPLILNTRCDLDVYAVVTGKVCVGVFQDGVPGGPVALLEENMGYRAIDT
jgi:serine/threonine protein phosphatase 1